MGSGADTESGNDPYEKAYMSVNGTRLLRGSPVLLQNDTTSEFKIWAVDWPSGIEFRLVVVSGNAHTVPDSNTWVKAEPGLPGWSIKPEGAEDSLKLVLFTRSFNQTLELSCELFRADHPWYSASRFYVFTPNLQTYVTHKAVIPVSQTDYDYQIILSGVGSSLFGKEMKLEFTGSGALPVFRLSNQGL